MLRIDRKGKRLSPLEAPTLGDVSITERYDLQEFISNSPEAFFKEFGLELFVVDTEFEPSTTVPDRIDILAVDKEGRCAIVELKRGSHKLQMLQAISYAGMIARWEPEEILQRLDDDRQEALIDFLDVEQKDINKEQRIILMAEAYDYSVLVSAEWLSETHGVDVLCCRVSLAKDSSTEAEYLVCSVVYPARELLQEAVARGRSRGSTEAKWPDWDSALSTVKNDSVVTYFKRELESNRESRLTRRYLLYRVTGKTRWRVTARNKNAYVWQKGRFDGDVEFWRKGLSEPQNVKPVKDAQCLRLFLETNGDFEFFHAAVTGELQTYEWLDGVPDEELEVADSD